ncbi:MAG: nucleoside deaminase [Chitinophagaceae bacterium]|nr:nucleoside deaminase [Chitinophagaceae bacterium]
MTDEYFMKQALKEAQIAYEEGEVPVGAIVVIDGKLVARGHNMTEKLNDPTAHAEMIALTSAFSHIGAKYLPEATLYVTVEPCLMCAGALYWGKVKRIVWGADDEKNGHQRITKDESPFHQKAEVTKGVLKEDCARLMKDFFASKR